MTATITQAKWCEFIRREYLDGFVRDGGAVIKFCVPIEQQARAATWNALGVLGRELGYIVVKADAGITKISSIDQLLFYVAKQIDCLQLAEGVINRLCEREGYELPKPSQRPFYERVAECNGIELNIAKINLERALGEEVSEHPELAKDFKTAMTQLCLAQMRGGADAPLIAQALIDWLRGNSTNISAVKRYQIFTRITRANARRMLESLMRWVVMAGCSGTIILMDLARLAVAKNPRDDRIYYTTTMLYDAYEVLREFVDSIDRMTHCFIAVLPDASFLDELSGRGIALYQALRLRIIDEVRAREVVNPMAALVPLSIDGLEANP
jgi:hypothetical protein